MEIKLLKKIIYTGRIKLLTGMHIGGTNSALNIGGPDKFVVRNPITNEPYIPGSSFKGKMRSLIEVMDGSISEKNGPSDDIYSNSCQLFGMAGRKNEEKRPSRLIVRDASLDLSEELARKFENTELPFAETKTEVSIDRVTSAANPRTFERVPAGAEFKLEMVLNVFSDDNENQLKQTLSQALKLIQDDYIGGHGSRGYGQIRIEDLKEEERTIDFYKI